MVTVTTPWLARALADSSRLQCMRDRTGSPSTWVTMSWRLTPARSAGELRMMPLITGTIETPRGR
jgi:hypothetical protein